MERITLICQNCQHEINIETTYLFTDNKKCELCSGQMKVKPTTLTHIVKDEIVERMKEQIKEYGLGRVWRGIESIALADARVKYRQYYFEAGGIAPQSEVRTF